MGGTHSQHTGNSLENMNCILLQSTHCSLQCGTWDPWLVEHWRCWCLCSPPEKHRDFHFLFFPITFPWHPFSSCLDDALGCGHLVSDTRLSPQAGAAAFQYSPPNPSAPRAGCPCLVPENPRTDRHTGHTALRTLFTPCPCRTQPNSLISSILRHGFAPCPSGSIFVLSERAQHS